MQYGRKANNLFGLGFVAAMAMTIGHSAEANSRFTIDSRTDRKLSVDVFRGDDSFSDLTTKTMVVDPTGTSSIGCTGGGKQRCKVTVRFVDTNVRACKDSGVYDTCDKLAIILKNHSTLVVTDETLASGKCSISR